MRPGYAGLRLSAVAGCSLELFVKDVLPFCGYHLDLSSFLHDTAIVSSRDEQRGDVSESAELGGLHGNEQWVDFARGAIR